MNSLSPAFELLLNKPRGLECQALLESLYRYAPVFTGAGIESEYESETGTIERPFELTVGGEKITIGASAEPLQDHAGFAASLAAGHYKADLKQAAAQHQAFIRLELQVNSLPVDLEQLALLAAATGALCEPDSLLIVHRAAHSSLPAGALVPDVPPEERFAFLKSIPPALLYCGFIKYEIQGRPGIWMTTRGAELLGLPDLAMHVPDHSWGQKVLNTITALQHHALKTGAKFRRGEIVSLGKNQMLVLEEAEPDLEITSADWALLVIRDMEEPSI